MVWLDALGWLGSALLIFSLLQRGCSASGCINLFASVVLTTSTPSSQIWPMVAMNAALALINTGGLRKLLSERHDDKAFEVLEVGPTTSTCATCSTCTTTTS